MDIWRGHESGQHAEIRSHLQQVTFALKCSQQLDGPSMDRANIENLFELRYMSKCEHAGHNV